MTLKLLVAPGCSLLFQDRCGAGRGRNTGRSTGRHHDVPGARHSAHGEEERHRAQSAVGRDARLHVGDLLGQDWHAHHQPDVCLPGTCWGGISMQMDLRDALPLGHCAVYRRVDIQCDEPFY